MTARHVDAIFAHQPLDIRFRVGRILRAAAFRLSVQGWCQNADYDAQGGMCTTMAIIEAARPLDDGRLYQWKHICAQLGSHLTFGPIASLANQAVSAWVGTSSVAQWNDRPTQTLQAVLSTLRVLVSYLMTGAPSMS